MRLKTRIRSTAMRLMASAEYLERKRARSRLMRRLHRSDPVVHYFHQVDDPYSHLAVQKLDLLRSSYDLRFQVHLVSGPPAAYLGSSEHFAHWALTDARSIAPAYGTSFTPTGYPDTRSVAIANDLLASRLERNDFATLATEIGSTLWSRGTPSPPGQARTGQQAVAAGNALRRRLGHYLGGMFYFEGEWFWGIDRIRLLEQRLIDEGFSRGEAGIQVAEPVPENTTGSAAREVTLEYFPSLRSPYTAVGHQRVLDLIERSGVSVKLRPVMPMMMRGVPAPRAKQRYIIIDAAREARARSVPFGRIVDPFGEPVRRAFALFPAAVALGGGMAFVTAYLHAAWAEGVDITTEAGLRVVAGNAGLAWSDLKAAGRNIPWESVLEDNVRDMLSAGLWGVPSFRVSGGKGPDTFACWGQDRIWRVENEIAKRV